MSHDEEEKKATAELLSGFDRPGRTPRAPRVRSKDFVDHYSGRRAVGSSDPPASQREKRNENETNSHERATVLVPRRNNVRAVMTWVVAVAGMILFGATIAVLSTPQPPASSSAMHATAPVTVSLPPMTPTSATTVTSANPSTDPAADPAAEPEPTQESAVASPQPPVKKATAPMPAKSIPRDDFIRDL